MAQVIEGFVHNKEEIEDAKKFNTFKFQAKFFFNTLFQKRVDLGKEFYDTYDKF